MGGAHFHRGIKHTRGLISTLVAFWSDAHCPYILGRHVSFLDTNRHSLLGAEWFGPEWLKFSSCVFSVSFQSGTKLYTLVLRFELKVSGKAVGGREKVAFTDQ